MRIKEKIVIILFSALCLFGVAHAQFSSGSGTVTQAQLDAVSASIPTPSPTVPLGPSGLGVTASDNQFVPALAQQRQTVMRTTLNTDASGNWSVLWGNGFSFQSSTPTLTVTAGNPAGSNSIVCNWRVRSTTGASGFCQQTNTALIALLGITITVAPTTPALNTPISVIMAEPTQ